jgi:response regulator RpfG family c-di-GMP phosphodiesterase
MLDRLELLAEHSSVSLSHLVSRSMAFCWIGGLQSVVAYLVMSRLRAEIAQQQHRDGTQFVRRERDLARTQNAVLFGLAKLAESRDPETGQHLERIAHYSTRLSDALRRVPKYREQITPSFIRMIGISSALHDIGKVGIEDQILLKPGRLDPQERLRMQVHAVLGGECIREIETQLGGSNFLQMAREIAFHHHERWDGLGYPDGLAGEDIPLSARIVAIADVYDALSVRRVYKAALDHEKCVEMIRAEAGRHFDPTLVEVFLTIESDFRAIAREFRATEVEPFPLVEKTTNRRLNHEPQEVMS